MEVITQNPVLFNKSDIINGYTLNSEDNASLYGRNQNVNLGDIVVKGTNPVFAGNKEISQNEFLFAEPVEIDGNTLTPMDEYLYSNANGNPLGKTNPLKAGLPTGTISIPPSQYLANLQNIPGGPNAKEQADKAKKEGQFWNSLKGGWEKFRKSDNGQILLTSGTSYLVDKLGGTVPTNTTTTTPPADAPKDDTKPMSKTTKTVLIVGGIALLGLIIYSVVKKK